MQLVFICALVTYSLWIGPDKGTGRAGLNRSKAAFHLTVVLHVVSCFCVRYYEDFKITSGTSNLTQIFVEASIAYICMQPRLQRQYVVK